MLACLLVCAKQKKNPIKLIIKNVSCLNIKTGREKKRSGRKQNYRPYILFNYLTLRVSMCKSSVCIVVRHRVQTHFKIKFFQQICFFFHFLENLLLSTYYMLTFAK